MTPQRRGRWGWAGAAVAGLLVVALVVASRVGDQRAGVRELVFGTTLPITGEKAEEGRYTRDGYLMWANTINAQGGLLVGGRRYPVRLVYFDDESDPAQVPALYERLIEVERVDFLLGPYSSRLTEAAVPVAAHHRVPMVSAHGSAESIFAASGGYTFSIISPAQSYLRGLIEVVLEADPTLRRVALLGSDEPFAREALQGATTYAAEQGLEVVYTSLYPLNPTDLTPLLAAAQQAEPELLLVAGHLQDAILIVRQAKGLGFSPRAMGFTSGPSIPQFRANLQGDADWILGATQWTGALRYTGVGEWPTPGAYSAAFRLAFPQYDEIPYQTAESTAALLTFEQALQRAGTLDRAAVRQALADLDILTFYGRIRFDPRGINVYKPMAVEQLHPDGRKYTVYPSDVAEAELLYPMPPWAER